MLSILTIICWGGDYGFFTSFLISEFQLVQEENYGKTLVYWFHIKWKLETKLAIFAGRSSWESIRCQYVHEKCHSNFSGFPSLLSTNPSIIHSFHLLGLWALRATCSQQAFKATPGNFTISSWRLLSEERYSRKLTWLNSLNRKHGNP